MKNSTDRVRKHRFIKKMSSAQASVSGSARGSKRKFDDESSNENNYFSNEIADNIKQEYSPSKSDPTSKAYDQPMILIYNTSSSPSSSNLTSLFDEKVSTDPLEELPRTSLPRDDVCRHCALREDKLNKRLEKMEKMLQVLLDRTENILPQSQSKWKEIEQLLPLQSKDDVWSFDELIKEESFRKSLVNCLYLTGGEDVHKRVYNILRKIFTPEVTEQFSATGGGGKESFARLNLNNVVKEVIRRRFEEATDGDIKKSIIRFFVSCKDRIKKQH